MRISDWSSDVCSSDLIIDSLSDAEAAGRNEAAAKARLEGFGDLLLDSAIFRGRRGQEIGQIGGFARGSSGVLPLELEAAKSKGRGLGLLGDLLTGAGMVTGVAGAAGVGPQNWGDITSWFSKSPKLVNTGLAIFRARSEEHTSELQSLMRIS